MTEESNATTRDQIYSGNFYCFAAIVLWALAFPITDILLKNWDPILIAALRLILGTCFLMIMAAVKNQIGGIPAKDWLSGLLIGGIGFGFGTSLMIIAQDRSDAVTVAIIGTSMPIFAALLETVFGKKPLYLRVVIGICLAIVGGVLASGVDLGKAELLGGEVIMLASVLLYVWASREASIRLLAMSALSRTMITMIGASLVGGLLYIVCYYSGYADAVPDLNLQDSVLFGVLAFGTLAISTVLWFAGINRIGVTASSIHLNAAPFYVMVLMSFLGAIWYWDKTIGAVLVILGALVAQGILWPNRKNLA